MKKFTKTLSIVLLVAMCVGMFTVSSFAAHTCKDHPGEAVHHAAVPASCTENGSIEYWACGVDGCPHCYKDAALTQKIENASDLVIPAKHTIERVPAVTPDCQVDGNTEHWICKVCGQRFADEGATTPVSASDVLLTSGHVKGNKQDAFAADCENPGFKAYFECAFCGIPVDADGKELTLEDIIIPATDHSFDANDKCTKCGELDIDALPDIEIYATNGSSAQKHIFTTSNKSSFEYKLKYSDVYEIVGASIGGYDLSRPSEYSYDSGYLSIKWSTVNGYMEDNMHMNVEFTVKHKATGTLFYVDGFVIENGNDSASSMGDLYFGALQNARYVKGGNQSSLPWFKVGAENVDVYLFNSANYTDKIFAEGEFGTAADGKTTFTFSKAFLDTLKSGYYTVRLYANGVMLSENSKYLQIAESGTNTSEELIFSGNDGVLYGPYKYIGDRVKIKSSLFTMNETLQYSSDIHSGWRDVGVNNYYVEQSNGKDSAYAYIGTSFLNNLTAGKVYYFRIVVGAKELGRNTDLVSNYITLETGNNIKAVDTDKHVINSSKSLKFIASTPVDVVKVGSIALVEGEDYAISKDNKTITLLADFLNKRTAGSTYTLTAVTPDGEELKTTFKILTTAQASASPRTGDDSNIALWSALVLMSGAAMVAVLPRLKKEQ